uniref:hypothetical protein n=1 Tax=Flavobacterium sp. TaxID=239 RepID=UPI004049E3E4
MKKSYLVILVFMFFGCKNNLKNNELSKLTGVENIQKIKLEESFVDSLKIGVKGAYKINLNQFRTSDSVFVEIKLFEKQKLEWVLKQKLEFLKDGITSSNPEITDFNNDGFGDLAFQSSISARSTNVIRKLLIFQKESGKLLFIKNAEYFPSFRYNKELNCIDAIRVYNGTQSLFAIIENDTLREFANVEIYQDTLKIIVIDKAGKQKLLKKEKYENGFLHRFINYSPLVEDKDYFE